MLDTLEQVLPPEVAIIVFRFSVHPTASLMARTIREHKDKQIRLKEFCKRNQQKDKSDNYCFYLYWCLVIKIARGLKVGKMHRRWLLKTDT